MRGILAFLILLVLSAASSPVFSEVKSSPKLKATATDSMELHFVADEKNLRRLIETVTKRISEQQLKPILKYVVAFSDQSYYETEDSNIFFSEENPKTRRIVSLEINARGDYIGDAKDPAAVLKNLQASLDNDESRIKLKIGPKSLSYEIRGPSRDWVFNTQSDITERFRLMGESTAWMRGVFWIVGIALGLVIPIIAFGVVYRNRYDRRIAQTNPEHQRTSLWKYIRGTSDPEFRAPQGMGMLNSSVILAIGGGYLGNAIGQYLFPEGIFVIGDHIKIYEDIRALRTTILWGLLIAFAVSLTSSVLANALMARRRRE